MIKRYIKTHLIYLKKRENHFFHSEIRRKASMIKTKEEAIKFLIKYPVSYYKYFSPSLKNDLKVIETLLLKDSLGYKYLPHIQKYHLKNIKIAFFFVNNYLRYYIRKTKIPVKQKKIQYKINSDFLYQKDFKSLRDIINLKRSIKIVEKFQFE